MLIASSPSLFVWGLSQTGICFISRGNALAWLYFINLNLTEMVLSEMKFPLSQPLPIYCGWWRDTEMSVQQRCYQPPPSLVKESGFAEPDNRTLTVSQAMKRTQVPGSPTTGILICLLLLNTLKSYDKQAHWSLSTISLRYALGDNQTRCSGTNP